MTVEKDNLFLHSLKNFKYFLKYYKKQIIIALLVISALVICGIGFSADIPDDWQTNPGKVNEGSFKMLDEIVGSSSTGDIANATQVTFDDSGAITVGQYQTAALGTAVTGVNDVCKGIALLVAIMTFMISLLMIRDKDQMDEEFIRRLLMFIVALVFIINAKTLSLTAANLGSTLATKVVEAGSLENSSEATDAITSVKQSIYENTHVESYDHGDDGMTGCFDDALTAVDNQMAALSYWMDLVFPWLAMQAVGLVTMMTVYGRAFEILALIAFSPLAFMETPDPGDLLHGPGMRFLKNVLALSISGAIIIFIVICTHAISISILQSLVSGGDFGTTLSGMTNLVIIGFAQAGAVMKSQQIAKTAVGIA